MFYFFVEFNFDSVKAGFKGRKKYKNNWGRNKINVIKNNLLSFLYIR